MNRIPLSTHIFGENSDDYKYTINHRGDYQLMVLSYHNDRTFNQMRRDIFVSYYADDFKNLLDGNKAYGIDKHNLQKINGILYNIFINSSPKPIWQIIYDFNLLKFNMIEKEFLVPVRDARFIKYGKNHWHILFLAEDCRHYYSIIYYHFNYLHKQK